MKRPPSYRYRSLFDESKNNRQRSRTSECRDRAAIANLSLHYCTFLGLIEITIDLPENSGVGLF